ncbi:dynamin family protein [Romboutsia lituseburensis]|uniref:dynamin family protein n=1 Tax=Romboutsia lituseburensis TaxID=1537 RepID=UPI00215AD759|nr:dynamin family protein [Romboutsia lituseburensis]MCR8744739.1 dynamin family protein [Romboutsia lituseburensis]
MEKNKINIYDIKEQFLNSPIRKKLIEENSLPFKNLIYKKLDETLENIKAIENNKEDPLKIVIVGEVKSGKSSLVNALLGCEVSEVDVLETTSNILEVIYDSESYITKEKYVTKVRLNLDYLKNINIVDTPGLKSITKQNEEKTMSYIKNADLILFVIDATHLGQEDISDALDLICEYKKPIVGVINKSDLLDKNKNDTLEYINDEYGIYMDKFFMVSSYLEYQGKISKKAIAKDNDLVISNYTDLKKNFNDLNKYIQNIYENCDDIKKESRELSIKGVIQKEIINHHDYIKSISITIDELNKYEKILQNKFEYIKSKMDFEIDDWSNRVFFNEEIEKIKENITDANLYINENYVAEIINKKKIELDDLFFLEWSECIKEVSQELDENIKKYVDEINYKKEFLSSPNFNLQGEKANINDMLAVVGTGAVIGATSGSIVSLYSALIGGSAASVTIGSALMMYCPPLLIAGTVSGAIAKAIYDKVKLEQKSKDVLKDVDDFIEEVKYKTVEDLKNGYESASKEILYTTLDILKNIKGIYNSKYDLEILVKDSEEYINNFKNILM